MSSWSQIKSSWSFADVSVMLPWGPVAAFARSAAKKLFQVYFSLLEILVTFIWL